MSIGERIEALARDALARQQQDERAAAEASAAAGYTRTAQALAKVVLGERERWEEVLGEAERDGMGGLLLEDRCYCFDKLGAMPEYGLLLVRREPAEDGGGLLWYWTDEDGYGIRTAADLGRALVELDRREQQQAEYEQGLGQAIADQQDEDEDWELPVLEAGGETEQLARIADALETLAAFFSQALKDYEDA